MAVLPPVIVSCVEPLHTMTNDSVEPLHVFDPCEVLNLMVGTITTTAPLSWILYNSPITPASYNLYRIKPVTEPYFTLLANVQANTYNDTGLSQFTEYKYYVTPVFPNGFEGIRSNILDFTTPSILYMYSSRPASVDIYSVATPSAMSFISTFNVTGANVSEQDYADSRYLFFTGGVILDYSNPISLTNPANLSPSPFQSLIRRNVAVNNNTLICYCPSNGYFYCYNLSSLPSAPTLISSTPGDFDFLHGLGVMGKNTLCYDSVNKQIVYIKYPTGGDGGSIFVMSIPISDSGVLGAVQTFTNSTLSPYHDASSTAFIHNGIYWYLFQQNTFYGFKLDGSAYVPPGATIPGAAGDFSGFPARLSGNYLFLAAGIANAGHQAVIVYDIRTWTIVAQLGGVGNFCSGLTLADNLLFYGLNFTTFVCVDISQTLLNGSAPVQLGTIPIASYPSGIAGYISTGWDGNNGGCIS